MDETIVFHALDASHLKRITGLMLDDLAERLLENRIVLEVSEAAKQKLAEEGSDPEYGARPLRRAIQRLLEDPLSEAILRHDFPEGSTVVVDVDPGSGRLVLRQPEPAALSQGRMEADGQA